VHIARVKLRSNFSVLPRCTHIASPRLQRTRELPRGPALIQTLIAQLGLTLEEFEADPRDRKASIRTECGRIVIGRRDAIAKRLRGIVGDEWVLEREAERRPFECDGLTAYSASPLLVVPPESTER
jgi:hypothetical protein